MIRDPQTAFEEKAIEDPELELLIDMRLEHAEGARLYAKANRKLKAHIEAKGYEDEVRYRCGEYVFRMESKDREGYEVGEGQTRRFAELEAV